jgi:hypothetical protein
MIREFTHDMIILYFILFLYRDNELPNKASITINSLHDTYTHTH